MPVYKTPGVYVEEISTLPPSVAEVSTAIPAFIGYTQKYTGTKPVVARVNTLLEFEDLFGGPDLAEFTVDIDADAKISKVTRKEVTGATSDAPHFLMYYAVSHYFKNGGGSCYIVSVGSYGPPDNKTAVSKDDLSDGLDALKMEDEPTLILLTDAVSLSAAAEFHELCTSALDQAGELKDRFVIFDVKQYGDANKSDVDTFRTGVGQNNLAYGAAYYPYLQTSLSYLYREEDVTIRSPWSRRLTENSITVSHATADTGSATVVVVHDTAATKPTFTATATTLTITIPKTATGAAVVTEWGTWKAGNEAHGFNIIAAGDGAGTPPAGSTTLGDIGSLADIKTTRTALYNQIKARLADERVVLPPSAAVAGIYARVDRDRGVWKAPANVSLSAVIGPVTKLTNTQQDDLNVHSTGKSINAIRAFTGQGTLVWGARTLLGNDNEWRYVPVRRLFNMIEESVRKSTSFAVFEPNDMTTWLKVKGMIEGFLYTLWGRGALAGPTPAAAYFVNVGLGKTMTPLDILEGRMNVELGIAAVRPAEFIILKFSHKLQEA